MKSVGAAFPTNPLRLYDYFVPEGDNPQVGDIILTSVNWITSGPASDAHLTGQEIFDSGKLARVVTVSETASPSANKFYMALISVDAVLAQREANKRAVERETKRAAARKKLEALLAKQNDTLRFKALAEVNPEAAELLKQLED